MWKWIEWLLQLLLNLVGKKKVSVEKQQQEIERLDAKLQEEIKQVEKEHEDEEKVIEDLPDNDGPGGANYWLRNKTDN
jgi:hypothetical protein